MPSRKWALLKDDLRAFKGLILDRHKNRFPRFTEADLQQLRSKDPLEILITHGPSRPSWMTDEEPLLRIVDGWEHSLRNSKVVWAVFVKANRQLWSPGTEDCPALVAWSPDEEFGKDPADLRAIVEKLHKLHEASPNSTDSEEFHQFLNDDMRRESFYVVPKSFTNGRNVVLSTIMVFRNHLPDGYLAKTTVPICVGEQWDFPVILPAIGWNQKLVEWWNAEDTFSLIQSRISMLGGRGKREASLPPVVRHFLTANFLLHPWFIAMPFVLLALGGAGIQPFLHRDPTTELQKFFMIGSGMVFLSSFVWLLVYLLGLLKTWIWHQDLIDLYEGIWKIGGVPWTRFYLMPHPSFGFHSYALVIKVVGHWFAFMPSGTGSFLATVSEAPSDAPDSKGPMCLRRMIRIPSNEMDRTRTISDLKAQFRDFGEDLRAGRMRESDELSW